MPTQRPPDVPATVPQPVADYLRRLATWAYQEIDRKIPKDEATLHVLLAPSDQKPPTTVFSITVDHTGAMKIASVALGGGKP